MDRFTRNYLIILGAIDRTTKPQTDADRAKWEVSALQWADLTANGYGVSLLNDRKYPYGNKKFSHLKWF